MEMVHIKDPEFLKSILMIYDCMILRRMYVYLSPMFVQISCPNLTVNSLIEI